MSQVYGNGVLDSCAGVDLAQEVGAPAIGINEPFAGFVLTPQAFSTSYLVLGPVL
jgi:hypothetical protein